MPILACNALGTGVEILLSDARETGDAFRCSVVAADMFMRLAEITHQAIVRFEVDLLIAKEKDAVRGNGLAQLLDLLVFERPGQIDMADFGPDMGGRGAYSDGLKVHGGTLLPLGKQPSESGLRWEGLDPDQGLQRVWTTAAPVFMITRGNAPKHSNHLHPHGLLCAGGERAHCRAPPRSVINRAPFISP